MTERHENADEREAGRRAAEGNTLRHTPGEGPRRMTAEGGERRAEPNARPPGEDDEGGEILSTPGNPLA